MKEKTEKCLEGRRRGADDVVCWSGGAWRKEKKSSAAACYGNFCKKPKIKIKLGLGIYKDNS